MSWSTERASGGKENGQERALDSISPCGINGWMDGPSACACASRRPMYFVAVAFLLSVSAVLLKWIFAFGAFPAPSWVVAVMDGCETELDITGCPLQGVFLSFARFRGICLPLGFASYPVRWLPAVCPAWLTPSLLTHLRVSLPGFASLS